MNIVGFAVVQLISFQMIHALFTKQNDVIYDIYNNQLINLCHFTILYSVTYNCGLIDQ